MTPEQRILWQYIIQQVKKPETRYVSVGSEVWREMFIAADEELTRLRLEVAELRDELARLERRLGGAGNDEE